MGTTEPRNAEELARAAQSGSVGAFEELVERFEGPLYAFLSVRCERPQDAEDLTQETLVRAWDKLALYDPSYRFSTWLFTLARNLSVSHMRRSGRRPDTAELADDHGEDDDPSQPMGRVEESRNLWALAQRVLGEDQLEALWLRYGEEHSITDIAEILKRKPENVSLLLFRAREKLARHAGKDEPSSGALDTASAPRKRLRASPPRTPHLREPDSRIRQSKAGLR